ncbi:FAD:protein FMN transferase [Clostridium polyendosporum]|uniref:FAD:protein FMN transferase n=1 Tax=Clostridium polyendosporum TaxID=69208 RepID=A0A919VGT9_9CLOT|nr:FAD:protein FMN transferase [Clostridium polyendosporum]GIM29537.1 FAD:protein FMN transferase [Clostridium polyendosporum]
MFFIRRTNNEVPIIKEFYVLGTVIQLKVYGKKAEKAIEEAIRRLYEIDDKMSAFKEYSEVSKINKSAGRLHSEVSNDTYFVIKKAVQYSKLSEGAFDPTIRPIVSLWGINTSNARIPHKDEINNLLKLVNYGDVSLNDSNKTIKLNCENQCIDVGGIAKGYAADEVKNIFKKNKIQSALIDLGGNIFAYRSKPDGTQWNIGIQDPFSFTGEYGGIVSVKNKSIVTSGNYERYFIKDGKRFHHIIDPRTGYPSENGVISVTIISDYSIDGDALSTCAYVMGLDKGIKLIESLEGVDAIFITEDKKIHVTSGVKNNFKLCNSEFIYQNYMN